MTSARRIACVFAHPDDETFSVGGTIARSSAAGARIDLFCATDGDAGQTSGLVVASRTELGTIRRTELAAAARVLGIGALATPGHADGMLREVDPERLIGEVVLFLRSSRPEVVVTFGPEGAPNEHRDHKTISRAATAAYFLAGLETAYRDQLRDVAPHRAARLFYCAWPAPASHAVLPAQSVPLTVCVDVRPFIAAKRAAFAAHASQQQHRDRFESVALRDAEHFALVHGTTQPRAVIEDLFEGM